MEKTSPYSVSVMNLQRVLYLLRTQGPLSRAEIARQTNLTKATSSKIVEELERQNLICPVGVEQQGRGRPSVLYEFNSASAIAVGAEILGDELQAVVTQLDARPQRSYACPLPNTAPETVVDTLESILASVREDFSNPIIGMGIGLPGICDDQQSIVILSERLGWNNVPLAKMIRDRTHLDACVENRANAAALGERWYGNGRDSDNFIYVHIGSGIKAGIVLNGEIYPGSNGSSGEIGHMTIVRGGPVCVCGKRGCLEALASTLAIRERVVAMVHAGKAPSLVQKFGEAAVQISLSEILAAAQQKDPVVMDALREAAEFIGLALANVVTVFNPKKIILGSFVNQVPPEFLDVIRQTVAENTFDMPLQGLEIIPTELSQEAVAIGAAALLLAKDLQGLQANVSLGISSLS